MLALQHRVRVFVFQFQEREPRYLLLRHRPLAEWPLGPVIGSVGHAEHLVDTVLREVTEETGLVRPTQLLELADPTKDLFGDVGLIEWPFAYEAASPGQPAEILPGPTVGEFAWMGFDEAFRSVEGRRDRDALVRLQLKLAG
ncbi:MAG: NUDIX hydrolase [Planctomycetota bacterium]|nr:NUDIX hydrolase [Planctomycetota bacterium]MDA0933217.1 NUDIX hydrolase [Planctomycetota bacterium]MDA1222056.1 NUDIX hydrolase [Planctomycetota bacterium]